MKLFPALASASVLLISGVAFAQDQPATPPAPPAQPADPAPPATPTPPPPATAPAPPTMSQATYGKGWNAKKCAAAKSKGQTIPDGACPDQMAPK
jgi:hypothetical protein